MLTQLVQTLNRILTAHSSSLKFRQVVSLVLAVVLFVVITIILSLTKFCCKGLKRLNQTPGGGQYSPQERTVVSLVSYFLFSPLPIFFLANLLLWDGALIFKTAYYATILVSF